MSRSGLSLLCLLVLFGNLTHRERITIVPQQQAKEMVMNKLMKSLRWSGTAGDQEVERERFSSRMAFIFAAVGSAVGFGNVWRFPALAASYGGGAFFIPYIIALLLIGIPIIFLEISLGQLWQTGDFGVFRSFHKRMGGVGVSSIACGYIVVTYYSMLIAWVLHAFFDSWSSTAPWTDPEIDEALAKEYFFNNIMGMSTINDNLTASRIIGANVGYSFLAWVIVFICTAWGEFLLCFLECFGKEVELSNAVTG